MTEEEYWAVKDKLDALENAVSACVRRAGGDEQAAAEACDLVFETLNSELLAKWGASHPCTIDMAALDADVEESLKHFNDDLLIPDAEDVDED